MNDRKLIWTGALGAVLTVFPLLVAYAAERTVHLSVPGMNCPACPFTVKKSLERVAGVSVQSVDLDSKTAVVTATDDAIEDADLIKATTDAGYPSSVITGDTP